MNTADEVYLTPERPGEGSDPDFVRFSDGLGLTTINMVPHYQWLKSVVLDGKKLIDEIVAEDSCNREIYLIPDGSYFMIRNGITEFFGEGLIMENGDTRPLYSGIINSDNRRFKEECIPVFDTKVSEYYDWVLEYDTDNGQIEEEEQFIKVGVIQEVGPECKWCQAYVPILNEVADIEGLEKIYYYDILEARKNNTSDYQKMVAILSDYLQYDDEGNKRIYVPAIIFVSKGEIVGFDDETSYDTKGFKEPEDYWTEEEISDLKSKLTESMNKVLDNKCTDCNE
jgi:hypothetical protein